MQPVASRKRLIRAALGAMLGAAVLIGGMSHGAVAADDEDDAWDIQMLRGFLKNLGLRRDEAGIDYRERSPLVVPPNRNLVPPVSSQTAQKNPAWPKDPDVKRQKQAKVNRGVSGRSGEPIYEEGRPLRPDELRNPGPAAKSNSQIDVMKTDPLGPMKPPETDTKGFFSSIFNPNKEEYQTFTGETPRTSLIEPPPGYRTPSPYQPYGVGKEKAVTKALDPLDMTIAR